MSESAPPEVCAWCGEPAVTHLVVVPGRKNKRYQPVCEEHAEHFERQGQKTRRLEDEALSRREREHADYLKRTMPWLNR